MTKGELISRITEIEWEDFEVKTAASEIPKSSWETVSAFANTNGGWLIFGIKQIGNNYEITGVKNADRIKQSWHKYNQTTPEIIREFDSTTMILVIKDTDIDTKDSNK